MLSNNAIATFVNGDDEPLFPQAGSQRGSNAFNQIEAWQAVMANIGFDQERVEQVDGTRFEAGCMNRGRKEESGGRTQIEEKKWQGKSQDNQGKLPEG